MSDVVDIFVKAGYEVVMYPTQATMMRYKQNLYGYRRMIWWYAVVGTEHWMKW
ncbi:MAG: hypothetical protein V8S08_07400 [Lachnoclostridium sp.]